MQEKFINTAKLKWAQIENYPIIYQQKMDLKIWQSPTTDFYTARKMNKGHLQATIWIKLTDIQSS